MARTEKQAEAITFEVVLVGYSILERGNALHFYQVTSSLHCQSISKSISETKSDNLFPSIHRHRARHCSTSSRECCFLFAHLASFCVFTFIYLSTGVAKCVFERAKNKRRQKKMKHHSDASLGGMLAHNGVNGTETQCVPPYGRSSYKAIQIFFLFFSFSKFITRLNQKLNFNAVACEDFALRAWFPPPLLFSQWGGVLTVRLRRSCLSSLFW